MAEIVDILETELIKKPDARRTIGEVAKDLGVATHVLRFWEEKFSHIKPIKSRGRRYYDLNTIAQIQKIKSLLYDEGYTIKGVQKYLHDQKKRMKQAEAEQQPDLFVAEESKKSGPTINDDIDRLKDAVRLKHALKSLQDIQAKLRQLAS